MDSNGIVILAGYLSIVILRGKRDLWKLVRAVLFTSYWEILRLFATTRQAASAWVIIISLLLVNSLASSAYAAGELKKKFYVPLYIVLLILIPLLTVGSLMLYNFLTFNKKG